MLVNNVCYSVCPWGFKVFLITGEFGPMCTPACREGEYGFPCDLGCSAGLGSCLANVKDQVGVLL